MTTETVNARQKFRGATIDALKISVTAVILGLVYTCVMGRGFFGSAPTAEKHADTSITLTFEEARDLYLKGDALFVDARHSYDFGMGHIKGAISVPLSEFDEHHPILEIIPKDRPLVVYCDGAECNSSKELALKLTAAGYVNVKVFFGGWTEWVSHDQPRQP